MSCPTQRTHATGLWVARNTACMVLIISDRSSLSPGKRLHHQRSSRHAMERSSKFGILTRAPPRSLQPGAPHSTSTCSLGTYLEITQQASLLKPACCTSGRERGQASRALRASPRPSPWNHQRQWSSSRSHQLVRISGHHLCRTRGSPQLDADRQQYAAATGL
jgi:hypothetical protein